MDGASRKDGTPEKDPGRGGRTVFAELVDFLSLVGFLYGRLDGSLPLREALRRQSAKPVPRYRTLLENNLLACFDGWLFRGIHHGGANLLVAMVILHMMRVFFTGTYRPPREMTWVNGIFLFFLTGMSGFTGRILTWDQSSYWATAVGTENLSSIPVVGETAKYLLRAGGSVGQLALTRFFALPIVILPGLMFLFPALRFLTIRRQGIAEPL